MIDEDGPGLKSLIFSTAELADARGVFDRRALKPDEIVAGESINKATGGVRYWSRLRLDEQATHGVRIFVLQRKIPDPLTCAPAGPGSVAGLDHVVIHTANPDRAAALYGARLGLRLALDRTNADWDMRLMFFRAGGITVELAHRLSAGIGNQPDKLWGLSWRVPDIEAAHQRMVDGNMAVSSIRAGRRTGTRVFSVKDGTLGTPTLVLSEQAPATA
jgi:catechol 2,3-dioxygenase-like lactoylglutathione lyase family enzyme